MIIISYLNQRYEKDYYVTYKSKISNILLYHIKTTYIKKIIISYLNRIKIHHFKILMSCNI